MKRTTLTVDAVIEIVGKIVLIKRRGRGFKGYWALPGGHVNYMEKVEHAAVREAKEETGLKTRLIGLIGVYSDPKRNPDNEHRVAIAFSAKKISGKLKSGDDAEEAALFSEKEIGSMKLAFDHSKILKDYFKQEARK
ncbi:MAG: NUDIX hydrolase [Candidatus Aenigmarchaeota archaeon]|nr:NUDIX hydrolase [Candidatus Aenigmarchaeota archaeon]